MEEIQPVKLNIGEFQQIGRSQKMAFSWLQLVKILIRKAKPEFFSFNFLDLEVFDWYLFEKIERLKGDKSEWENRDMKTVMELFGFSVHEKMEATKELKNLMLKTLM